MLNIKKWEKYKQDKKIAREIAKKEIQIQKRKQSLKLLYDKTIQKYQLKQQKRMQIKESLTIKKKQRELDTFIRAQK